MLLWRIAGASHVVWSGEGARLLGARWNPPGLPAIYAGTSYAISMLEILVHANMTVPPARLRYVQAEVPEAAAVERVEAGQVSGWNATPPSRAQAFGRAWLLERRSLVLLVPSVVTSGLDWNAVINPLHPDFPTIAVRDEAIAAWDSRLRHAEGALAAQEAGAGTAPAALPG